MDFTDHLDLLIQVQWDDKFIAGLDSFLRRQSAERILDCCAGTGFPALRLKQMGWQITVSDGSSSMLDIFRHKMLAADLVIDCYLADWAALRENVPDTHDAVLCRGNSFVYIDSWDENRIGPDTPEHMQQALKQFYKMLNPGGLLYLDIAKGTDDRSRQAFLKQYEGMFEEKPLRVDWSIEHDHTRRTRHWKSQLWWGDEYYSVEHTSFLLYQDDLIAMLLKAGFARVEKTAIGGEGVFDVFIAYLG